MLRLYQWKSVANGGCRDLMYSTNLNIHTRFYTAIHLAVFFSGKSVIWDLRIQWMQFFANSIFPGQHDINFCAPLSLRRPPTQKKKLMQIFKLLYCKKYNAYKTDNCWMSERFRRAILTFLLLLLLLLLNWQHRERSFIEMKKFKLVLFRQICQHFWHWQHQHQLHRQQLVTLRLTKYHDSGQTKTSNLSTTIVHISCYIQLQHSS